MDTTSTIFLMHRLFLKKFFKRTLEESLVKSSKDLYGRIVEETERVPDEHGIFEKVVFFMQHQCFA